MALGGPPVSVVDAGGLPVTNVTTPGAVPFTVVEAPLYGMPVTLADNAWPVTLLDEDGNPWEDGGGGPHASDLLEGETQGLAIDFTLGSGLGEVAVIDTGTPANNKDNVPVDQFLTQSGTSPKLVLGADGLYRWSPHNLIPQSQTFDHAGWNKIGSSISANAIAAPDGSMTADALIEDATTTIHYNNSSANITAGAAYTLSVYAKKNTRNYVFLYEQTNNQGRLFDLNAGAVLGNVNNAPDAASITDAGSGWWRCSITITAAAGSVVTWIGLSADGVAINYAGNGTSGIYLWGAQLNRGATALAYHATTAAAWFGVPIEYGGGGYYALVEPQSTNVILQSQAFDNASWVKSAALISANAATAPDGTVTADKLVEDTSNTIHDLYQGVGTLTAAVYTHSVHVKAGERTRFELSLGIAGGVDRAVFDLSSGTVVTSDATHTPAITNVGNGWYRCSVAVTASVAAYYPRVRMISTGTTNSYAGDGASGFYLWGAQVELGATATSPIPTFAATVTRAADNLNVAASTFPLSATAGTITIRYTPNFASGGFGGRPWTLSDTTNFEQIFVLESGLAVNTGCNDGGVLVVDILKNNQFVANALIRIGVAWAVNDFAQVVDGQAADVDASATLPTMTRLYVGSGHSGVTPVNGRIHQLVYLPRRMTNADLQTETAP